MNRNLPSQLQFAIIGCGAIGRKRAASMRPGQLLYACDIQGDRAAALAKNYVGVKPVTNYLQALEDPAVDAIIVATLNGSLADIAIAASRSGKHVLIEKPGALNALQLREVEAAATAAQVQVRLGYNHRFHPALQKARELVDSGALGPLMFLRGRYGHGGRKGYEREWRSDPKLSGGGELIDQGVHLIDLATWFLGDFPQVTGHATTCFWDMKVDDNAFLCLRNESGNTAWLHVSCTEWKNMFSLELYGRDGKISIDGLGGSYGPERCTYYKMLPQMGPPETIIWEFPPGDNSWAQELAAFEEDIRTRRTPSPGLREGVRILEIVDQIYRSSGYSFAEIAD